MQEEGLPASSKGLEALYWAQSPGLHPRQREGEGKPRLGSRAEGALSPLGMMAVPGANGSERGRGQQVHSWKPSCLRHWHLGSLCGLLDSQRSSCHCGSPVGNKHQDNGSKPRKMSHVVPQEAVAVLPSPSLPLYRWSHRVPAMPLPRPPPRPGLPPLPPADRCPRWCSSTTLSKAQNLTGQD